MCCARLFQSLLVSSANNTAIIKLTSKVLCTLKHFCKVFSHFPYVTQVDLSDLFHSDPSYFPLIFCKGKRFFFLLLDENKKAEIQQLGFTFTLRSLQTLIHISQSLTKNSSPNYIMLLPFYLCNISDQNIFHICGCRIQLHHQALEKLYKTELARKSQKWSKQCLPFGASQGSSPIRIFLKHLLTSSVISIFRTAVVLKDGEPRSLAWTTNDHMQSLFFVMLWMMSSERIQDFSLISPVLWSMSNTLAGSACMME